MKKLADISSVNDLSDILNIDKSTLNKITYTSNRYYSYSIEKKQIYVKSNNYKSTNPIYFLIKTRIIHIPNNTLKEVQSTLANLLYGYYQDNSSKKYVVSYGFIKDKCNLYENAQKHLNKKYILNIDLKDFFHTVTAQRVYGYFKKVIYKDKQIDPLILTHLTKLICTDIRGRNKDGDLLDINQLELHALPQGAPTSPIMSHLITSFLDKAIHNLIVRKYEYKIKYSRYFDDMTFSTNDEKCLNRLFDCNKNELTDYVKKLIEEDYKFNINYYKVHLKINRQQQQVTGLIVNNNHINVNRRYIRNIRSDIHKLLLSGGQLAIDNNKYLESLLGKINFVHDIRKSRDDNDTKDKLSIKNLYYKYFVLKYFLFNPYPTLFTEGDTDIEYLLSSLKVFDKETSSQYSSLYCNDEFKILFRKDKAGKENTQKKLSSYIHLNGESNLVKLLKGCIKTYKDDKGATYPIYDILAKYTNYKLKPFNPVIFLFDRDVIKTYDYICKEKGKSVTIINKDSNTYYFLKPNIYYFFLPKLRNNPNTKYIEDYIDNNIKEKVKFKLLPTDEKLAGSKELAEDNKEKNKNMKKKLPQYFKNHWLDIPASNVDNFKLIFNCIESIISDYQLKIS